MHDHDDHRHGLQYDLEALAEQRHRRRSVLAMMGGGSLAALAAAFPGFVGAAELCIADPETTNGPYPADGSNTAPGGTSNILTESGVLRSDIRSSFGTSTNTAPGVPLTLNIKVGDAGRDCAALAGYAVYVWHCTQDGLYSLYTEPDENYLRGVQIADADGMVSFTTIFPGCYRGRWPHIHFEVYPDAAAATDRGKISAAFFRAGGRPGASGTRNRVCPLPSACRRSRNPASADRRSAICRSLR